MSPKMDIKEALRLINRPSGDHNSPASNAYQFPMVSGGAGETTGAERHLDLLYLPADVPIVRIDAWFSTQHTLPADELNSSCMPVGDKIVQSDLGYFSQLPRRDFALVSCVYGGQLSLGVTASAHLDGNPGVDLILIAMQKQVTLSLMF